jgi:hypothetical protein
MVALQAQEIAKLRVSNKQLQEKQKRSRKHLQHGGVLQIEEGQNRIIARHEAEQQRVAQHQEQQRQRAPRTCSRCGSLEYTARTCNLVNYIN